MSCATFVNGGTNELTVESPDQAATVTVLDENNAVVYAGTTPATIELLTGDGFFGSKDYTVKIAGNGFKEQVIPVETSLSWWYLLGNLVSFGPIGWFIIDPVTGAMWVLDREQISLRVREAGAPSAATDHGVTVALLDDVPAELRGAMLRIK